MRTHLSRLGLVSLAAFLVSCGGETTGPPPPAAVATVTVTPPTSDLGIGETVQLSAQLRDSDGNTLTGRTVTWSSSAPAVASVSGTGSVAALSGGSSTITATSEGRTGTATVNVREPVAAIEIDPAAAEVVIGNTQQLTVTLKDGSDNVLTGRTVTYATSDAGVATVSSSGLVTGVDRGGATITVTSEGVDADADITVVAAAFNPQADTDISGDQEFEMLDIPDGVTVTLVGETEINVFGDAMVAGDIVGDCHEFTLRAGGNVTITGDTDNSCQTDPTTDTPGNFTVIASDELRFDGVGTTRTSGDVVLTNDETLTDDDFTAAAALSPPRSTTGQVPSCFAYGRHFEPDPAVQDDGADGTSTSGAGRNGRTWTLRCRGDLFIGRGTLVEGQWGGDGGTADNSGSASTNATATAGRGGRGGTLKVFATGQIDFQAGQGGTRLALAHGGHGGDAIVATSARPGNATATGGAGGDAGDFKVTGNQGIFIRELVIEVGDAGWGGDATADAGDGDMAGEDGGDATANGGRGGDTPEGEIGSNGAVFGLDVIVVQGGSGGHGGDADAHAGKGADGDDAHKDGANGGNIEAEGGNGGDYLVDDGQPSPAGYYSNLFSLAALAPIGPGGFGGDSRHEGGEGALGYDGCQEDPPDVGGKGGNGGAATKGPGTGGMGTPMGEPGHATVAAATGDAGSGNDGEGPGTRGMIGNDGIMSHPAPQGPQVASAVGGRTDEGPNFQEGTDGAHCFPFWWDWDLPFFVHEYIQSPCPQEIGEIHITNHTSEAASYFIGSLPQWISVVDATFGFPISAGTIPPGGSVWLGVDFNCTVPFSEGGDPLPLMGSFDIFVDGPGGFDFETFMVDGRVEDLIPNPAPPAGASGNGR